MSRKQINFSKRLAISKIARRFCENKGLLKLDKEHRPFPAKQVTENILTLYHLDALPDSLSQEDLIFSNLNSFMAVQRLKMALKKAKNLYHIN